MKTVSLTNAIFFIFRVIKGSNAIQPWWLSGLECVSNSSRHSPKGPKFESRWRDFAKLSSDLLKEYATNLPELKSQTKAAKACTDKMATVKG